jgi:3-hydroxyanthranilate 3,4-dioxygenase
LLAGQTPEKTTILTKPKSYFTKLKGDIEVTIQENGKAVKVPIKEGDMFLLPANVPHSPVRSENSIGLVIERKRKGTNLKDGLMWFCEKCNHKLYEERFTLDDIEKGFLPTFTRFYNSVDLRTCKIADTVMESDPKFTNM